MIEKAFLTGSRAYGTPRADSDIDVVAMMSHTLALLLVAFGEAPEGYEDDQGFLSVRFGMLNLMCCWEDEAFFAWADGTRELIERTEHGAMRVTRAEAVKLFTRLRAERAKSRKGKKGEK